MKGKLRERLTFANVVSVTALFVALGTGGAYAANTVFSSDIVDGEVKTPDLANGAVASGKLAGGAVTSENVQDETLRGRDVSDNTLKGADIDESTLSSVGGGGPAGGDLSGNYPNPQIADQAVGLSELDPFAFVSSDIAKDPLEFAKFGIPSEAIGLSEMARDAVGPKALRDLHEIPGAKVTIDGGEAANGDWGSGSATAACDPLEDLIWGYGQWLTNSAGEELAIVEVDVDYVGNDVTAVGLSDSGAEDFRAVAVCLGVRF